MIQGEKECEICGALFIAKQSNYKYCPKCRIHPDTEKRYVRLAYRDSYERYADIEKVKLVNAVCDYCGKENTVLANVAKGLYFCSKACRVASSREHHSCRFCGKNLKDTTFYDGRDYRTQFCSQKCYDDVQDIKEATHPHIVKECPYCKKTFTSKREKTFCSNECRIAAVREGWIVAH